MSRRPRLERGRTQLKSMWLEILASLTRSHTGSRGAAAADLIWIRVQTSGDGLVHTLKDRHVRLSAGLGSGVIRAWSLVVTRKYPSVEWSGFTQSPLKI